MKKIILSLLIVCLFSSCEKVASESEQSNEQRKNIQFVMNGIKETYSTRASLGDAYCTDLWVFEGTTLLCHKVSTDADFDTPTISLTYGSHDLTFIASSSNDQTFSNGIWSTTKVIGDYATTQTVTINASSGNTRQVQLTMRSSRVTFQTTDNIPTTVSKCHLKVHNYKSLDALLAAGSEYTHEATIDISSKQGSTYKVWVNTLTDMPEDEEDCAVTIEFLSSSGTVLYSYDRTIKQKSNRNVTLTGAFFSGGSNSISIASTDFDEVTQQLYE